MLKELAKKYYSPEYDLNCAEAVVYAANEGYDLKLSKDTLRAIGGFGGGMAIEEVCGAITGAIAILGIMFVKEKAHEDEKIKDLVKKLFQRFEEKLASHNCKELKECYREEEPKKCQRIVALAADILQEIIEETGDYS